MKITFENSSTIEIREENNQIIISLSAQEKNNKNILTRIMSSKLTKDQFKEIIQDIKI